MNEIHVVSVSIRTIRWRLEEATLTSFRPANYPKLFAAHRPVRLKFASEFIIWTEEQWASILFANECNLSDECSLKRLKNRRGERYDQRCIYYLEAVRVWCGVAFVVMIGGTEHVIIDMLLQNCRRDGLTAQLFITEISEAFRSVVSYMELIGEDFTVMQDNTKSHAATQVRQYFYEVGSRLKL